MKDKKMPFGAKGKEEVKGGKAPFPPKGKAKGAEKMSYGKAMPKKGKK
jgi:hypothetical protein